MHAYRRWATEGFARELESLGLDVELRIIEYVPGVRGLGPVEWTEIFVGDAVVTSLIGAVVEDIYAKAKEMLRSRVRAKKDGHPAPRAMGFKIYGPDGEVLKEWKTTEDEDEPPPRLQ